MVAKKASLGRGLSTLITNAPQTYHNAQNSDIKEIPVDLIDVNPFQPRTTFDQEALDELAGSIRELGIIQPITVRMTDDGRYQIISGERRTRASKLAGLSQIPAYVRKADDQGMLEMALVENIQRQDLDAIEIAISYQRLIDECNFTQDTLSGRVGKKRATIGNYIRLLNLPIEIQSGVRRGVIGMGHARALVAIDDPEAQLRIFEEAVSGEWSVRQIEERVRILRNGGETKEEEKDKADGQTSEVIEPEKKNEVDVEGDGKGEDPSLEPEYERMQQHLSQVFQARTQLRRDDKGRGKIVINFRDDNELERILGLLSNLNA